MTIRIQPPMIEVPKGAHCNPFNGKTCEFLDTITSDWWCQFEGRENCLEWDIKEMAHFKTPFCSAACAKTEKAQGKMTHWIHVKEQQPEYGLHVLGVDHNGYIFTVYYDENTEAFCHVCSNDSVAFDIVYWRELPAPPEETKAGKK